MSRTTSAVYFKARLSETNKKLRKFGFPGRQNGMKIDGWVHKNRVEFCSQGHPNGMKVLFLSWKIPFTGKFQSPFFSL